MTEYKGFQIEVCVTEPWVAIVTRALDDNRELDGYDLYNATEDEIELLINISKLNIDRYYYFDINPSASYTKSQIIKSNRLFLDLVNKLLNSKEVSGNRRKEIESSIHLSGFNRF